MSPRSEDRVDRIQAEWSRERPDVDVRPQAVIGRLHRLAATLTDRIVTVHRQHGLTEGEFDVLCALRRAGEPYARQPAELARTTMITTGGLTKRLDALEGKGFVVREASGRAGGDGRSKVARLTAGGRRVIDEAFSAHMANEAGLVALLADEDFAALERILRSWHQALEAGEGSST